VAPVHGYITGDGLASHMAATAAGWETSGDVGIAITTASRDLDAWCGRRFWKDENPSARVFYASPDSTQLRINDAVSIESVTVNGSMVDLDELDELPLNGIVDGIEGWPVTALKVRPGSSLAFEGRCIVTAPWGWDDYPSPVVTACLQLAAENMKMGEAPFGVAGLAGDGSAVRIGKLSPQVRGKLQPYRTGKVAVPVG
jgi:hypothetical protein